MSVVVIRDGVIAADTGGYMGDIQFTSGKLKREGNTAVGYVGQTIDGMAFAEWYFAGADRDNLPAFHNRSENGQKIDFCAFVLKPDGWEHWDEWFYPDLDMQRNPYMAIGTGCEAALGAMYMGATAIEAVEAACATTAYCSLSVEHESIEQTVPDLDIKELGRILHELEGGRAQPLGLVE